MRGQTFAKAGLAVLLSVALAACSGGQSAFGNKGGSASSSGSSSSGGTSSSSGGGSSGGSSGAAQVAAHVILVSSSPTLSSTSTVTLTATVTNSNNVAIPNYQVSFTANGGVLVPAASTTDSNGNISATLSAGSTAPGTTITVSATAAPLSAVTTAVKVASTTPSYALGTLSGTGTFTSGAIAIGQTPLAAGGSSGLQVSLVDTNNNNTPYSGSATVTFSSPCQSKGLAQITSPVTSSTGTFNSTYKATGCSGNDVVTASATITGGPTTTASGTINVQPATLGSIQFDAATTSTDAACGGGSTCTIGLKGTGQNETANIYFKVLDTNGNPVPNQTVSFSLSTTVGGLSLNPTSATSNSSGEVVTTIVSGTVHTSVRVTASITSANLSSQSSLFTVSTGFPTPYGMSVAATSLNLIGDDLDGNTSTITVRLSDRYANPVPDGTAVSFASECGQVQPSCNTTSGACSVTFTTAGARTGTLAAVGTRVYADNNCAASPGGGSQDVGCNDHRCTVLAYVVGEESFNDCNGTGLFESVQNPNNNATKCPNGDFFVSLPEAWLDTNESGVFNGDFETYIDFNNNGQWDAANGQFIGLLCNDPLCDTSQKTLNVFYELPIVMTSTVVQSMLYPTPKNFATSDIVETHYIEPGQAGFSYINTSGTATVYPTPVSYSVMQGCTADFQALLGDSQWQVPPVGTTFTATMATKAGGSVVFGGSATVGNTDAFGYYLTPVRVSAPTAGSSASTLQDTLVLTTTVQAAAGQASQTVSTAYTISYPPSTGTCP